MGKGMEPASRGPGDVACMMPVLMPVFMPVGIPTLSLPKKGPPFPALPGGIDEVGEGSTSANRAGGSFLSLFHIPAVHCRADDAGWRFNGPPALEAQDA